MTDDVKDTIQSLNDLFYKSVGVKLGFYNAGKKEFKPSYKTEGIVLSNASIIEDLLNNGYTPTTLRQEIINAYKDNRREPLISKIVPKKTSVNSSLNLIEPGKTYTHRELYVRSQGSYTIVDGDIIRSNAPSNRLKEVFTLNDLLEFCYLKLKIVRIQSRLQYDLKILTQFLEQVGLDALLYAIESAEFIPQVISLYVLTNHLSNGIQASKYRSMRNPDI